MGDDGTRRGLAGPTMTPNPTVEVNVDTPLVMTDIIGMAEGGGGGACDAAANDPPIVLRPRASWPLFPTLLSAMLGLKLGVGSVEMTSPLFVLYIGGASTTSNSMGLSNSHFSMPYFVRY